MPMLKTENLATIANTILKMTFKEVVELAGQVESDGAKLTEWAELYVAPVAAPQS